MGFRDRVEKVGPAHYVLAPVGEMRCPVDAWLDEGLFAQTDESLWRQAALAAGYQGALGLHLMPDTHLGYGIPVGGVLVTSDTIVQAGSGYDISCGVVYMRAEGLTAADVADWELRRRWVDAVELRVATGLGDHRPKLAPKVSHKLIDEVLFHGAKALGVSADLCERQSIDVDADLFDRKRVPRASAKAQPQLGSVGGGNHFIELQVDRDDGSVWVMVHCGSRGFGWQTANHFFYKGAEQLGLPKNRREESWLDAGSRLGQMYWAHHNAAANYAVANRHLIVHGVREATQQVLNADVQVFYEISHNLVQRETLWLPDGSTQTGFVHRKGATRAFPAGHPDLRNTRWADTGHPVLIPGSMIDGAAILYPQDGARRSACSVNHGSGRVMGRGQARRELTHIHDEIDHEMRSVRRVFGPEQTVIEGVVGNTERTPLDECGHVYKDLDQVLGVLETEGIATVAHRLYPVANLKGVN